MTRIIAIAALAVRSAIRSRLFLTLAVILLLVIFALPLTIKGDGTPAGQVKILLYYTLGLATVILGVTTLWTSCAAISNEIAEKQIQMSVAKPVHRFQIWLGKWIGILAINAILLLITGVAIYAYARHYAGSPNLGEKDRKVLGDELLVGRRLIVPEKESVDREARDRLDQLKQEGHFSGMSKAEALERVKKALLLERTVVAPSQSRQWKFQVQSNGGLLSKLCSVLSKSDGRSAITVRFRLASTYRDRRWVTGTWIIAGKDAPASFRLEMKNLQDGEHSFSVPVSAMPPGDVMVTFANADGERSRTAIFDSEEPIQILIRESSFAPNLIRSLIVILCQLGLVAAIGLTAGALFSFPVATFAAMSVLLISLAGHFFSFTSSSVKYGVDEDDKVEMTFFRSVSEKVVTHLEVVIAPVMELSPLGLLSDGILVSWSFTGQAIMLLLILYPAFFWLVGAFCLSRRELALPTM